MRRRTGREPGQFTTSALVGSRAGVDTTKTRFVHFETHSLTDVALNRPPVPMTGIGRR